MNADRTVLTDGMWARTGDMLPGRKPDPGGTAADSRLLVEAVPVRFRTGSPWRDLPKRAARWRGVSRRFRRRVLSGVPERVFNALSGDSGPERVSVDGTAVQAPRKAAGARKAYEGGRNQGTGRSRGGLTTRTVAVVDAPGYLVRFRIPAARAHDLQGVPGLPGGLEFGALVGDRASGADWLLDDLDGRGAEAAVPPERNRTAPRARDREMYGWRHLVDSFLPKTGEFRAVATRYDRTAAGFAAGIRPVAGVVAAS